MTPTNKSNTKLCLIIISNVKANPLLWGQKCSQKYLFVNGFCPELSSTQTFLPFPSVCLSLSIFDVKMADIHKVYLSSLFLAYLFQFQNPALLSSPLLSLLIGSVLARYFQVELAAPSRQSSHGCWSLNFDNCIIIQFIKKETFFCNFSNIRFFFFFIFIMLCSFFSICSKRWRWDLL